MSMEWFSYDHEDGCEFHATEAEARLAAEQSLEMDRDFAVEGWPEWVEQICYGRIVGRVVETERRPATDEDGLSGCDEYVEYALVADGKQVDVEGMAESELGRKVADDIIANLRGRSGGDWWFDGCEHDVQEGIRSEWSRLAKLATDRSYQSGIAEERARWVARLERLREQWDLARAWKDPEAVAALEAAVIIMEGRDDCDCSETSSRNCPEHGNG